MKKGIIFALLCLSLSSFASESTDKYFELGKDNVFTIFAHGFGMGMSAQIQIRNPHDRPITCQGWGNARTQRGMTTTRFWSGYIGAYGMQIQYIYATRPNERFMFANGTYQCRFY
jgi:hypothetical protein